MLGKEHSGGSGGASRTGTRSARRRRGTSSAFRSPSAVSARGAAPGYANAPSATLAAYPWICAARRRLSRAEAARIRRVSDSGLKLQRLAARLACFRPERVLVPATNAYRHQDGLWFLSPAQTAVYTVMATSHEATRLRLPPILALPVKKGPAALRQPSLRPCDSKKGLPHVDDDLVLLGGLGPSGQVLHLAVNHCRVLAVVYAGRQFARCHAIGTQVA